MTRKARPSRQPFLPRLPKPTGYDQQTYASPYFIVRYPHKVRYRTAVDVLISAEPSTVLDYGAGDGHLLIEAINKGLTTPRISAYEPVEKFQSALLENVAKRNLDDKIQLIGDRKKLLGETFEYIVCLGVLEHLPLLERQAFYELCEDTLSLKGRVLIDVPVEIGPTLVVKNLGRVLLKGREKEYDWAELSRLAAGGVVYDPSRFDPSDERTWINDHKGFDYRLLRRELAYRFDVTVERVTPLPFLPAPLGNQEIFFTLERSGLSPYHESHSPHAKGDAGHGRFR